MGRSPCCDETGLKKGPWTPEEDQKLLQYIHKHGHGSWRALPKLAGLNRCGKSCRLRWTNYLRPDIKRGKFSAEEEQTILDLHSILGNKWSAIATHLPGRTDNEIKNFWNTHMKKRMIKMGLDPMTHRPRADLLAALPHLMALASLRDLSDHDHLIRMQADAAKLQYLQYLLHSSAPMTMSTSTQSSSHTLGLVNQPMLSNPLLSSPTTLSSVNAQTNLHLWPEMDSPCTFDQLPLNNEISKGSSFVGLSQGEDKSLSTQLMSPSSLPLLTDVSAADSCDGCSSSIYINESGSSPLWTELFLDETLMVELP